MRVSAHVAASSRAQELIAAGRPRTALVVGIDVAEAAKGLDLVALDLDRTIVASRGHLGVEEVVQLTLELSPRVVCIDSPSQWSTSGASRQAELDLACRGIQSYRTGADPGDHAFYAWMRVGFSVFDRLATHYPRYRGGDVTGRAAEVFPHATSSLLAGRLRSAGESKVRFRRMVLAEEGIDERRLPNLDQVDAALAALTGIEACEGNFSWVGDPDEGAILLPVATLPTRLRASVGGGDAIRLLSASDAAIAYEAAWDEWYAGADALLWDATTAHGLSV